MLFYTDPTSLKATDVLDAFVSDPRLRRVKWSEVKDVPVTKLAVLFGLSKSRGMSRASLNLKNPLIAIFTPDSLPVHHRFPFILLLPRA